MSTRASPSDVTAIIDFDPSITNLQPFIDAANELVTELCAMVSTYTDARLKMIETWLAAHFLAVRDPRYASESMGAASASYQASPGPNLSLTPYGQQAMLLDTNGSLAWIDKHISQGKRAKVSISYLGTDKKSWYAFPWRYLALGQY